MALDCHLILPLANVKYKVSAFALFLDLALELLLGLEVFYPSLLYFLSQMVVSISQIDLLLKSFVLHVKLLKPVLHQEFLLLSLL